MEFKEIVKNIMQSEKLKSKLVSLKSFDEVYNFFKENGYEGSEEKLKENLFSENSVTNEISEEELEKIAGGVSGKKAMAACASLMMLMGVAPTGTSNSSYAKVPFISSIIEKIKEKRHEAKHIKPTKKKPAEGNPSEERPAKEKIENYDAEKAEKAEKELERFFEEDFKGQEKAKEQIRDFFTLYNNERKAGANNLTERKLPSPKILTFDGPDGAGKRYMAEHLSKIFADVNPYITTAADIKRCAKNQYLGYADAFMHGIGVVSPDESLFRYLQNNEGKVKFVIIDNYHELFEKQEDGRYPEQHPLDEMFRDIVDNYLKDWYGNEVDLSGTIFICTTNETKASVQGKVRVSDYGELVEMKTDEKGYPVMDENGDYVYEKATTDGSRAVIPHYASLINKISNICYFDKTELSDYEKIARSAIQDIRTIKDIKEYKEYIDSDQHKRKPIETLLYERMYYSGLDGIIISDKGYKFIAERAEEAPIGTRFIVGSGRDKSGSVCGNLRFAIEKHCTKIKSSNQSYKGLTLLAEPYEDKDLTGKTTVRFKITDLGYDGYDKYLKEINNK